VELIDDSGLRWSPHDSIADDVAGVVNHCGLLFFIHIQGGRRIPSQGFGGQVEPGMVEAIKFIDSYRPYIKQRRHSSQV